MASKRHVPQGRVSRNYLVLCHLNLYSVTSRRGVWVEIVFESYIIEGDVSRPAGACE